MQTYLSQLLDDLAAAAKNPPAAHYFEALPHLEEDRQLSELAMVPYRTIEQLSGIKQEMFPLMTDLDADQCQEVNQAIFKLFEALHIELVDMPSSIPPEWLYEVLTTKWQKYVQYLPSSDMDLELSPATLKPASTASIAIVARTTTYTTCLFDDYKQLKLFQPTPHDGYRNPFQLLPGLPPQTLALCQWHQHGAHQRLGY